MRDILSVGSKEDYGSHYFQFCSLTWFWLWTIISPEGKTQFSLLPKLHATFGFEGKHLTRSWVFLLIPAGITWSWMLIKLPEAVFPERWKEVEGNLEKEPGNLQSFAGVPFAVCEPMHFTDNELSAFHRRGIYWFHSCTAGILFQWLSFSLSLSLWTHMWKFSWIKGSWWSASNNVCAVKHQEACLWRAAW